VPDTFAVMPRSSYKNTSDASTGTATLANVDPTELDGLMDARSPAVSEPQWPVDPGNEDAVDAVHVAMPATIHTTRILDLEYNSDSHLRTRLTQILNDLLAGGRKPEATRKSPECAIVVIYSDKWADQAS
jgi:hypothetical protein